MLKNLLKIAYRNLIKDKAYATINIVGLTIGITSSLFLLLYILDERSFDRYHKNAENIYRIVSNIKEPDNAFTWSSTQMPLADELDDNYPEIENAVRFIGTSRNQYKNGDQQFYESKFFLTDSTVFDMFTYDFIAGDPRTALDEPFSIVLTETIARKYFANGQDALNQSLINQQNENFKVTGVIKDVPLNSHFRFDGLISKSSRPQLLQSGWGAFSVTTYIQLPEGYDLNKIQVSLDKVVTEKVNPAFERMGIKVKYGLQRITDIHLHSKIQDEAEEGGDISYIYIFAAVGVFMILIACINYMNLATARSTSRAKEVGLRKVMGSQRGQLIAQFLTESLLVSISSLMISLAFIYALLPAFNSLANKQLPFSNIIQTPVMIGLVIIVLVTGILGGSYPAFYLSSFSPVSVLKGKLAAKGGSSTFRKSLVVIQFGLSIFMLVSTLVVFDQVRFLRNKDLGFDKENVVRLNLNRSMRANGEVLADRLRKLPDVVAVGKADASPGEGIGKLLLQVEDADGKMVDRGVDLYSADYDYLNAMGIKVIEGRNFSKDNPGDTAFSVVVNKSMVSRMGWKDPLGKKFMFGGGPAGPQERKVIGVINDYNQNSLYDAIEPLFIVLNREQNYVFVRLTQGDIRNSMISVEREWKQVYPNSPFEYVFLDEDLDSQYKADEKRSQIFTAFSALTVIIACLGLFGLAAYTTEQRKKEISVRKVIGASVNGLIILVSKEFFLLVSIGIVLAFPSAWYFTNTWLQNFAYRVELANEWSTFLISAVLAFGITIITVGYHVVRAATANPVNSLRDE